MIKTNQNNAAIEIRDSLGRSITMKKPDYLNQIRSAKILGSHAQNHNYIVLTLPLFFVHQYKGRPVVIKSEKDLELLAEELGEEGWRAINAGIEEHFSPPADQTAVEVTS